jgi:isoleucyl-tRNA synthetase
VAEVRAAFDGYDAARAARAIEAFVVDDLSGWYVRLNRRRFWKGELDADKRAAFATLHRTLVDVARLLAPMLPHIADALWENLVVTVDDAAPPSVHLADFPTPTSVVQDAALEGAMRLAQRTVALGRAARAAAGVRTRQPLPMVRAKLPGGAAGFAADPAVTAELTRIVLDELNAKGLELIPDDSDLVERSLYPLLPVIGPRHGADVGRVMAAARSGDWEAAGDGTIVAGGVTLAADEFQLTARGRPGLEVAEDGDLLVALDTRLTPELEAEGLAREVGHRLQNLRKAAGYDLADRVRVAITAPATVAAQLAPHRDWLAGELLATGLTIGSEAALDAADRTETMAIGAESVTLGVARA